MTRKRPSRCATTLTVLAAWVAVAASVALPGFVLLLAATWFLGVSMPAVVIAGTGVAAIPIMWWLMRHVRRDFRRSMDDLAADLRKMGLEPPRRSVAEAAYDIAVNVLVWGIIPFACGAGFAWAGLRLLG